MFKSFDTFTDDTGRIVAWPSKRRTEHRAAILDYLTGLFESGRVYTLSETRALLEDSAEAELVSTLLDELLDGDYLAQDERGVWRADSRPTGPSTPTRSQALESR